MASDRRAARLGVLAAVAVILFAGLGARLWFLQTVEAQSLQQVVDQRNTRTVLIAPERGQIFDHDGRLVAGNEPIYNVAVDWAAMSRAADRAALFSRLSGWVGVPVEEMERRYDSGDFSTLRPLPIAEDVPEDVVIALGERSEDFPGVTMLESYRRVYPYAPLAAHVVGYMGAITAEDAAHYRALGYDTSNRGEDVGRAGVELEYETTLHGKWGQIVYEVDSHGAIVREISRTDAVNGMDIQLSIDLDVQQYAERILQTQLRLKRAFTAPNPIVEKPDGSRQRMSLSHGERVYYEAPAGSVVVMDHSTGHIIAMASYPTFDNRWFSQDISGAKFRELFEIRSDAPDCGDEGQPQCPLDPDRSSLTNRAIQGQYNMGSAFKVFVAWSALHTGLMDPNRWIDDHGTYKAWSIPEDVCAQGIKCVWRNSFCTGINGPCRYGSLNMQLVVGRVERRLLLRPRRDVLHDARNQPRTAAERTAQLRVLRRDGDRPAVRVRRPAARRRDQGGPRRERCARRQRGPTRPPRRRHQPGDRSGSARRHADADGGRVRRVRQRRLRAAAPCRRGDLRAEHADAPDAARVRRSRPCRRTRALHARRPADPDGLRRADRRRHPPEHHRPRHGHELDDGRGAVRRQLERAGGAADRRQDRHRAGPLLLPVERLVGVRRLQPGQRRGRGPWSPTSRSPASARSVRRRSSSACSKRSPG